MQNELAQNKEKELLNILEELNVSPQLLAEYLERKIKEDRALQTAYKDIYVSSQLTQHDSQLTNAEILLLKLKTHSNLPWSKS